jgi:hypothetical protein
MHNLAMRNISIGALLLVTSIIADEEFRQEPSLAARFVLICILLMAIAVQVFSFSDLCVVHGIVGPDGPPIDHDPNDCLYFSVVTWTTLGYGDFRPTPNLRYYAALESIYGYLYMAVLVATLLSVLRTKRDKT